jgi:branched-chain amino acid aminotransferase
LRETVYLNGEYVPASHARLPVDDRGVLFGDGVFETVRAYRGEPFRLDRHLERMTGACRELRLEMPRGGGEIAEVVRTLIAENGLESGDARVRVTVTGGAPAGPTTLDRDGRATIFILARPYRPHPDQVYRRGISLVISDVRRNASSPLSAIKSANYLDSLIARQEAADRGADDAVILSSDGTLSEATTSNLFMVRGGDVLTPDTSCGLLPGITREAVIELCGGLGITCARVTTGPEDLFFANEVFLTNSMVEVLPVREIAGRAVRACPGPVTESLAAAYRKLVARETRPVR